MRIIAISDTHGKWNRLGKLPSCDILISAGDYSFRGEAHMVRHFHTWLDKQDAKYVISVQGNHEVLVQKNFYNMKALAEERCPGVYFIGEGTTIEIEGLKIFGSAVSPWFQNWAWNLHRGEEIAREWSKIEPNTDIVITHGPVYGVLDSLVNIDGRPYNPPRNVGCEMLLEKIKEVKPKVHICGHIHCGHGQKHIGGTSYYNVSICDEAYVASNPITIIDI